MLFELRSFEALQIDIRSFDNIRSFGPSHKYDESNLDILQLHHVRDISNEAPPSMQPCVGNVIQTDVYKTSSVCNCIPLFYIRSIVCAEPGVLLSAYSRIFLVCPIYTQTWDSPRTCETFRMAGLANSSISNSCIFSWYM